MPYTARAEIAWLDTEHCRSRAELMLLGQIRGIVQGLRYMGYVGASDNLVRR